MEAVMVYVERFFTVIYWFVFILLGVSLLSAAGHLLHAYSVRADDLELEYSLWAAFEVFTLGLVPFVLFTILRFIVTGVWSVKPGIKINKEEGSGSSRRL